MAITAAKLKQAIDDHPELLEDRALSKAVEKIEVAEAKAEMQPVLNAVKDAIEKCQASGTLQASNLEKVRFIEIDVIEDVETHELSLHIDFKPKAKRSAPSGSGAKVTAQSWKDKGFQAFVVNGKEYAKPKDAIIAAGGKAKVKDDGTPVSENYWRAILENGYIKDLKISIKVEIDGKASTPSIQDFRKILIG